jgi:hypothetical protein
MKDQRLPNGKCDDGKSMPDRGATTGVTDTYGTGRADLERGYTGGQSIRRHTGSDK